MIKKYVLVLITCLCFVLFGFGQIYTENFTGQNGKGAIGPTPTTDLVGVTWSIDISSATLSANTDWFRVQNEVFEARDIDGDAIWYSPSINISAFTNVQFSLDAAESGTMEAGDIFNTEYRINGGSWTNATTNGNLNDDFTSATVSQTGLNGNTLEIRVTMNNGAGAEYHRIDNILVTGTSVSTDTPDWCNLQAPGNGSTNQCGEYLVYARVYEDGITNNPGADSNIQAWIGYNTSDIDPSDSSWAWFPANYYVQVGNDDEYILDLGNELIATGTYYYASRFRHNSGPYVYGGYSAGGGNFWDGTTYVNGQVVVSNEQVNFCNVDYPKTATINAGDSFTVYAQVYEPGITDTVGQGANISAWIGYNTIGENHQPWDPTGWTWMPATYGSDESNDAVPTPNPIANDQYFVEIGSGLADGTYYFASRFQINCNTESYGGIQSDNVGNFWDATNNSGTLTVISNDCASESFINSGNSGSYNTETWTGDDGIDWTATDSRTDQDLNGNEAIILRNGSLTNDSSFSNGCGVITFDYAQIYSGTSSLKVFVNGIQYGGDITVNSTTSTTFSTPVNLFGNIDVEIQNSGNRTLINNLSWSCYACPSPIDASNFIATNGCGGIDLSWDMGCAEEVMIVAKQGSAVTAVPIGDGSAYTANTTFGIGGSGAGLPANEFAVYKGNGILETITGLNNGSIYHFTIFSRVGSTWSSGISTSFTTSITSQNVTTFTTYNNCGDISLNWTLPSCYDEVLVVAKNGSTVTAFPSGDGSAYTANATFGTGGSGSGLPANEFAVYQGNGTTSSVTGLTDGNTYHFEIFTRVGTTWSSGVIASAIASSSGGSGPTTFNPGDLVFIGFDSYIGGANDKYSILNMKDIGPGTEFIMANLLYEWNDAASTSSGKWYDCDNQFDFDPPFASIEYTGCSDIPKGSVICIETNGSGSIVYITINGISATSDFSIDTTNFTVGNISTTNPDAMWLMQGTFSAVQTEADGLDSGSALDRYRTFNGTVFGGLQTKGYFQEASDSGDNGGSRVSRIHPDIECLYLETGPTSNTRFFGFYYGTTTGSQYQLLANITDITNFWDIQSGSGGVQDFDNVSFTCSDSFSITSNDAIAGQWMGNLSTDWFDCHNWQNFTVPDSSVDVNINTTSIRNCDVDSTSPYAPKYNYIADCNTINLTNRSLIIDSNGDILNVSGDLEIDNSGFLDMNDGNNGTDDGLINLNGNWINNIGINAFDEGNGTVAFIGSSIQTILFPPPLPPTDTEEFYNVILDNNFNTGVSNNLHANGNLTINSGRTLTIPDGNYVYVNLGVTNNGIFNIENNGSLVQGSDTDVNIGNLSMQRIANIRRLDYVYWSSAVEGFNVDNIYASNTPTNRIYRWNPTISNPNGGQGNWVSANGETMLKGVGYIVRGPDSFTATSANITATFNNGKPFNGYIPINVYNGADSGSDDDDWNLLGNPYPSSINAITFLTNSTNTSSLEGFVNIWTHGSLPSTGTADPFYDDFGSNYTESDYITYNSSGSSSGAGTFNGYIAAGQSFMVNTVNGVNQTYTVEFRNNMRDKSYDNSQFFRTINTTRSEDKHRIWLDLVSDSQATSRILLGYIEGATTERDRMFDAITDNQAFYSLIGNKSFVIQGRGLPFNDSDIIPLGVKINAQGSHYIAIAETDGLFETEDQIIYLKDNLLNVTHNLIVSPYSFTSDVGEFNNRFEIVFRSSALSVDEYTSNSNDINIIELDNNHVKFKLDSGTITLKQVEIIDLLGRTVYTFKASSNVETYNLSNISSSTYTARITLSNDQVIVKKAIKK